jgi:hypothetical protein
VKIFTADTLELLADIPAGSGDSKRRSKVVGLVDAPGDRFVFSLYDAGEIWIADTRNPRQPQVRKFTNIGKLPYDGTVTPDGRYYIAGTLRRRRAGAARPVATGPGRAPRAGRLRARAGTHAGVQDAAHGLLGAGRRPRLRAGGGPVRGAGDRPERLERGGARRGRGSAGVRDRASRRGARCG